MTKLQNALAPNLSDKLIQLISMEPHIYDLDSGGNWFGQIPEETTQCSTKLMPLNYSYLKILKLKVHSLFGHAFLCPCYLMTRFYCLSHSCLFSPFLSQTKSPIFAVGFLGKPPELTKDPKWPTFAKWADCQARKPCYRHKDIYSK